MSMSMSSKGCQNYIFDSKKNIFFRRNFQFRIDNGDALFIDIEVPADRAKFHTLSLNLHQTAITGKITDKKNLQKF